MKEKTTLYLTLVMVLTAVVFNNPWVTSSTSISASASTSTTDERMTEVVRVVDMEGESGNQTIFPYSLTSQDWVDFFKKYPNYGGETLLTNVNIEEMFTFTDVKPEELFSTEVKDLIQQMGQYEHFSSWAPEKNYDGDLYIMGKILLSYEEYRDGIKFRFSNPHWEDEKQKLDYTLYGALNPKMVYNSRSGSGLDCDNLYYLIFEYSDNLYAISDDLEIYILTAK